MDPKTLVGYKLSNKEIKKVNEECTIGVGFDDTFKADKHFIYCIESKGSLLDKYPWERYERPYPPSNGLNSITAVLLEGWLWH